MLTRIRQVAIEQQADPTVAETLVAADVQFEAEEPDATYEREMNERNPARSSLSRVPSVPGRFRGDHTGRVELVGGGGAAVKPPTVDLWLASAHGEYVVNTVNLTGAPTGTYRPGERITDGGTKVGRFIKMMSAAVMLYAKISGSDFAGADTLTGSKSGATSTVHGTPAITAMGFAYKPIDPETAPKFTMQTNKNGKRYLTQNSMCMGNLSIEGAGRLPYFNYDAKGPPVGRPVDLALFTGVTLPTVLPESFLSAGITADGDSLDLDGFTLDLGIELSLRPSASAASGTKVCRIVNRRPTIQIAPYAELEAIKDFFTEYDAGTQFGFFAQCGSTASKRMAICAPNAQWSALPTSDREGEDVYDATLDLYGSETTGDDEYIVAFF